MNKKRKVTKRITAWILCLAMVLTTINLPAFSVDVKAAETVQSSITMDDKEYALYTGFTATDGSLFTDNVHYSYVVDGNLDTKWRFVESDTTPVPLGYVYVEFTSDFPVILKGYILNSYNASHYHPSKWRLYAKVDEDVEYELVSEYTDQTYSGTEHNYPVVNEENNQYRFFRFECSCSDNVNIGLSEIRLYGKNELTYGFMPEKSATCTATGIKQDCYLRSDGKYFTDETGAEELSNEDVIAPIKPHNFYKEDGSHTAACIVCGAPNDNLEVHDFSDSDGNPLIECICGKHNPFYGYCGDPEVNEGKDVTWRVTQEEDGNYTMTISGTGKMKGYNVISDIPWRKYGIGNYQKKITRFIVSEGVTSVGQSACCEFEGLKYIELSNSVTYISFLSFEKCTSLEYIKIPSSVTTIELHAFKECPALTKVEIPCTLEFSPRWDVDESKVEKYHVFEKQPFIDREDGKHYQKCKCGNESTTPENHNFTVEDISVEGAKKTDATCTEKAKYYKSCDECGAVSTNDADLFEGGEPLGHDFKSISATEHKCQREGCSIQRNHDFSDYEYDLETHILKCSECGYTKADDKEVHDFTESDICVCGIHKAVITDNGFENTVTYTGNPMSIGEGVFTVNSGAELKFNWYKNDYTDAELPEDTSEDYMGNAAPVEVGKYTLVISADAIIGGETDYTGAELRVAVEIKEPEPESYEEKERIVKMIVARQHNLISDYYGDEKVQSLYDYITLESGQDLAEFFMVLDMYLEDGKYKFVYVPEHDYNFIVTVEDGEIVEIYDTFFKDTYKYVEPQIKHTGLVYKADLGIWQYEVESVASNYTGLVYDDEIGWWYVTDGVVNFYTGLVYDSEIGWWYVTNGAVNFYTGLVYDSEIGWWYVTNGAVNFYTGLVYDSEIGWWYVTNGAVNFYTGLVYDSEIGWWYVTNGAVNFYTGLVYDSEIGWWYVTNGAVNFYTGLVYDNEIGWWYVVNGAVVFYDGLVYDNEIGWWYVTNGAVVFYTGLVYDSSIGWWYVENGAINFAYTGWAEYAGVNYYVVNGMLA